MDRDLPSSSRSTLASMGNVWRRSTTPAARFSGFNRASRATENFMSWVSSGLRRQKIDCKRFAQSGGQGSQQVLVVLADICIGFAQLLDLATGVQHGGVITPAETVTDFRQAVIGQLLGERHR